MPSNPSNRSNPSSRFQAVLAEILKAEEQGRTIDVELYCRTFPELAGRLRDYFRNRSHFARKAQPAGRTAPCRTPSSALPDLAPGSQFAGYEIVREMGRGGMGVVYLAWQHKANRFVALKLIRKDRLEHLSSEQRRQWLTRFGTEAKAAARIAHDRVVPVHEVGAHGGNPFYSMRYVEGQSLAGKIQEGPLTNVQAAGLMEQVARAVQAVHEHKILHRDLKPHNILVDGQGRPYLTDFGLAKCADAAASLTHTGEMLGSVAYMSPEQAQDSAKVREATDVYGLGATLYALLTGRPPFSGKTIAETLDQVKNHEPVPPRRLNPAVDRDLNTLILRCLEKEPGRRLRSAAALADELQRYLERRPILSRPIGPAGRVWRWCRRKPALATISAAAVLLLTFTGILAWAVSSVSQERDKSQQQVAGFEALANEIAPPPEPHNQPNQQQDKPHENQPRPPKNIDSVQRIKDRVATFVKTEEGKRALDYLNDMAYVDQLLDKGEHVKAGELLNKWRDSPNCAWEWHFAAARLRDVGLPASAQKNPTPAGNPAEGFTLPAGLGGHRREMLAVAVSPDSTRLASADAEGIIKIWDLTDKNKEPKKLTATGTVTALAWSPNGQYVVAAFQGRLTGAQPTLPPAKPANTVPPKPKQQPGTGRQPPNAQPAVARLGSGVVRIWDADTLKLSRTLDQVPDIHPPLGFSSPGVRAGATKEEAEAIWAQQKADTARQSTFFNSWPASLIWAPRQKLVLADQDGKIQTWDLTSTSKRSPVAAPLAHDGGVHSVALSPDGNRLASVSYDGVIKIWDLAGTADKPTITIQIPPREKFNFEPSYSLVWSKEGKCLSVVSRYGELREVDVDARRVGDPRNLSLRDANLALGTGGVGNRGERFVWSPDAKLLASIQKGGELKTWDAATGKESLSMVAPGSVPSLMMGMAGKCAPAWDRSGLRLVMGGTNGAIQAWPVVWQRKAVRTRNIPGPVGWSADSRFVLGVHVYSSAEDETLIEHHQRAMEQIKIMQENLQRNGGRIGPPDPRLFEVGKGGAPQPDAPLRKPRPSIKFHDSISGEVVHTFGNTTDRKAAAPNMLAASPDGKWVASLTHAGVIHVWPLTKGEQAAPIAVENVAPASASRPATGSQSHSILLAWSSDSRLLAYTRGSDSGIQIWDVDSQKNLLSLERKDRPFLRSLAWNWDGNRLAAASLSDEGKDGMVEVWDVRNCKVVREFPYFVKYEPHISKVRGSCSAILSWCSDKKRLAVFGDDSDVKVVDVDTGEEITTLHGRPSVFDVENATLTVAWSPDGKRLAHASPDETIVIRDTITWQEVVTLHLPKRASLSPFGIGFGGRLAWSPDGWQLAYFTGEGILIWDAKLEADAPVQPMPERPNAAQDNESTAAAALEKLGAKISRDEKQPGKPVIEVILIGNKQVTDADLKHLRFFTNLERLHLHDNQVTDAGLENIQNLRRLQILQLTHMQITDAGLKHLKELKNLFSLMLGGDVRVTDAGLKELKGLQTLSILGLKYTTVTDAGVQDLKNALPKCDIQR
jgi:serine/threonine protein kinase/WD40 repeat protein